jgi:hypothetical protein
MEKEKLIQLKKGIEAEMEHTKDIEDENEKLLFALKIAIDHIKEDPEYYDKLNKAGLEENPKPEPKYSIGDRVKWENQDWTVQLISNGQYKLKHSKGLPSNWISIGVLDSQTEIKHVDEIEEYNEGEFCVECLKEYILEHQFIISEAEYKGRKVQLGKPMAGDVKKFKVYVKNKKGKVIKVNFGQKGVKIKKNNPKRRKSFRARHKCHTAKDRTTPRYWSCRKW